MANSELQGIERGASAPDAFLEQALAKPSDPGILKWARALMSERPQRLRELLPTLISPGLPYTTANGLRRLLVQLRAHGDSGETPLRLAILGGSTTHPLADLLDLYLHAGKLRAEIFEADYGTFRQELFDPTSAFHAFGADFVLLLPTWRDIAQRPALTDDRATVDAKLASEVATWTGCWSRAHAGGAQVIHDTFVLPPARPLGNLDGVSAVGFTRFVRRLNEALIDAAPPFVTVHDADALAQLHGRLRWSDERFFHEAKLACAPEFLPTYAHSLAAQLLTQRGHVKKCLALDLDNTLWGGVIGDDGVEGIQIGQGDGRSEAFLAFQKYVLSLKQRGVILAVCSKNTESVAREAFDKHPEMVLRAGDIACFMANWDDKATNLARIAAELNIGLNSIVFVDDNPVERSIVRQNCPEVAVPELPEDPAYYIETIDRMAYFEAAAISNEDLTRTSLYQAEAARREASALEDVDLGAFLTSLELKARIVPIGKPNLDRSAQLINRSNQFNVTTRRHTGSDLLAMAGDPDWTTMAVSLGDRFGDNGLISVILARADRAAGALVIDTWLMSCRVLKRGVEHAVLNQLAQRAAALGLSSLRGEYIPTAKNALVKDLFATLGFTPAGDDAADGVTRWVLPLAGFAPLAHQIDVNEETE